MPSLLVAAFLDRVCVYVSFHAFVWRRLFFVFPFIHAISPRQFIRYSISVHTLDTHSMMLILYIIINCWFLSLPLFLMSILEDDDTKGIVFFRISNGNSRRKFRWYFSIEVGFSVTKTKVTGFMVIFYVERLPTNGRAKWIAMEKWRQLLILFGIFLSSATNGLLIRMGIWLLVFYGPYMDNWAIIESSAFQKSILICIRFLRFTPRFIHDNNFRLSKI